MSVDTVERDPEAFCSCGHHEDEHEPRKPHHCEATKPDRCSCRGFRFGSRARPYRRTGIER